MAKLWTVNSAAKEQFASEIHSPEKKKRIENSAICMDLVLHLLTQKTEDFSLNHKNKVNKHANHGTVCHKTMSSDEIFKKSSNKKCTLFMFYA
jgi:hypothetical protein